MEPEYYFMHCCFDATIDEVQGSIDLYFEVYQISSISNMSIKQYGRKGNRIDWWYMPGKYPKTGETKPFFSDFELVALDLETQKPTEVKITYSGHALLGHYLTGLAKALWKTYSYVDAELTLPQPDEEPTFKSLVEYRIEEELSAIEFDKTWGNDKSDESDDKLKISQYIGDINKMKTFYQDYSPSTADDIIKAIPQGWEKRNSFGGRWGPGVIAEFSFVNSTTVGRYLKAFKMAGLTEVQNEKGEDITIP